MRPTSVHRSPTFLLSTPVTSSFLLYKFRPATAGPTQCVHRKITVGLPVILFQTFFVSTNEILQPKRKRIENKSQSCRRKSVLFSCRAAPSSPALQTPRLAITTEHNKFRVQIQANFHDEEITSAEQKCCNQLVLNQTRKSILQN